MLVWSTQDLKVPLVYFEKLSFKYTYSGFPISILLVEGALPPSLGAAPGVGDGGKHSISVHVNIPASTLALHTAVPLSLTFNEEKVDISH